MLSSRATSALFDIRDNALLARQWTAGHTLETFTNDRQIFYAVTRCLEIVSEASRRLPSSLRDRHPHLSWQDIRDAGNVYRHSYDNVAEAIVWRTVQHSLDALLAAIEAEIARLG
jgi:uncharacterized protein with HEPN domain